MRPRAGSWFPCSPQHSPEQAANRVVVSRVGADVVERTPIARHCNTRLIQLLTSYQLIRRRRPSDHRNSRGSCPSPERRGARGRGLTTTPTARGAVDECPTAKETPQ